MNILITGGAGFIGSHVTNHLVKTYPEYTFVVLDKLDYCASMHNLVEVMECRNFKFLMGDITNVDFVNYIMENDNINVVMHFAAQTHVDNSFGNSFDFTYNNIYGTHVLLESAKNNPNLKRFIHVSTDEVYGETPKDAESGYTEGQFLNPTNPYSATKAAAEMLVTAYAHSYKLPIIITRGNNVYGPGQFPEKLIPKFCMRAMRGERLPVHGKGDAVRSYLYIDDVVEAFVIILHMGKTGETYNIGTKKERSVMDVAEEICNVFGLNKEETIQFVEDRPFNDCRYFIEDAKLAALGWTEKTTWTEGIKKTLAFYRDAASIWWKKSLVNTALDL